MFLRTFSKSVLSKAFFPSHPFSSSLNKYHKHINEASNPETLENFWKEQSKMIDWYKEPTIILDKSNPPFFRWFKDGVMNTSYNCLDRHIAKGAGNEVALIYESPVTNVSSTYTFGEVLDLVSRFANVLQKHGVNKGDRVIIYMPMIPEVLIATQACARIGAVHSIVFGGFSGPELATRIKDAQPKLIVTASCGVEPNKTVSYMPMVHEAVEIAGVPDLKRIVVQRDIEKVKLKKGIDFDFYDELANAKTTDPVPVNANDYLYILYTSGTTGTPKGIVRDNGGTAVALSYCEKYVLDIGRNDVFFCATDIGWVTGHSYLAYGPWLAGAGTILFEGKPVRTPDAGILWRLCEKHGAKGLFTSPTALRSIIREDPKAQHIQKANLGKLKTLLSVGEKLDHSSFHWVHDHIPKHCLVIDNYWQTETGWFISTNYKNLHSFPNKPGSAGKPTPGNNVVILDERGDPVPADSTGAICLKFPTPPSFALTLYNNDEGFVKKYMNRYPGYYNTEDAGYLDAEGYVHVVSRLDDVINTAGHRLSTSQMEEILVDHKDIVEAAVVGVHEKIKGEVPVGFVVVKSGVDRNNNELEKECIDRIRKKIGPVASFKVCMVVEKLPKTRSGKIVRKVLRSISNGEKVVLPPTIDDPDVVESIKKAVEGHGLGAKYH